MKTLHLGAFPILLLAGSLCSGDADPPLNSAVTVAKPDTPVVAKLRELVTIRERQAQLHQDLANAGRELSDPSATVAAAQARIELARELGNPDSVIAEMRNIVSLRRGWAENLEKRVVDRIRQIDLEEARATLTEAELRLLRELRHQGG